MSTKCLIVEDHPMFAEALRASLRSALPEMEIVQACALSEAKATLYQDETFDLVLLDLWLPDTHGFEGLIELRNLFPRIPIVVISAFADQSVVHKAIVCGALGFIPKSASKDALLQAIANVLAGDLALPDGYLTVGTGGSIELAALTCRLKSLTQQQLRVLQFLCNGLLNKQIAHELDINETTVKAHISEILRKLCVGSRTQAVVEVSKLDFGAVLALYAEKNVDGPNHAAERTAATRRGVMHPYPFR